MKTAMKSFNKVNTGIRKILALLVLVFSLAACHKDLGNYEIDMPLEPQVTTLDTLYSATVGDSLIIDPGVKAPPGAELELSWKIMVMTGKELTYVGPVMKVIFGLAAENYTGLLTVHNKTNGMKYFHRFKVTGATEFGSGTTVLSVENGTTQFSFIKPDGTLQARLYKAIHGKELPANPMFLFLLKKNGGTLALGYWIITKNGGVRLNTSTMTEDEKFPNNLADNFFTTPDDLEVDNFMAHSQGVMMGVVNGKFYGGTTSTWDQAPTYGMFGLPADGDYELAPSFVMGEANNQTYFVVFDKNKRQFQRINLYGAPAYFGTQYAVEDPTNSFNPLNVGMDLIKMIQLNNADCFAYMKHTDGKIYELKFNVSFLGPFTFTTQHKREFIRQDLITADTKWQGAKNGVIYIASGNKVVIYNPINQEVRNLATDLGGEAITMLKLSEDEKTLMVGTKETVWFTNINTGEYGSFIKKIEGIPGSPMDIAIR
jgi:hypothetical protein